MNYTQAQIDRANAVSLEDFLRTQGETLIKSGREYQPSASAKSAALQSRPSKTAPPGRLETSGQFVSRSHHLSSRASFFFAGAVRAAFSFPASLAACAICSLIGVGRTASARAMSFSTAEWYAWAPAALSRSWVARSLIRTVER